MGLGLPASLQGHPQLKKHRMENGDFAPFENGPMTGEFLWKKNIALDGDLNLGPGPGPLTATLQLRCTPSGVGLLVLRPVCISHLLIRTWLTDNDK